MENLKIKYLVEPIKKVVMPRRGDIGIDLYSIENVEILPGTFKQVKTGISVSIPERYAILIKDRSSMSLKGHVMAGVVDSGYTGEIKVVMYCHTNNPLIIRSGYKIAQMILIENLNSRFQLEEVSGIEITERGSGGFGSTGL